MENTKIPWAKKTIKQAIEQDGPYSHNICSMTLMAVSKIDGKQAANRLIEEYELDAIYGIQRVAC